MRQSTYGFFKLLVGVTVRTWPAALASELCFNDKCQSFGDSCCAPGLVPMHCGEGLEPKLTFEGCFLDRFATYTCCDYEPPAANLNIILMGFAFWISLGYWCSCCGCCRFCQDDVEDPTKKRMHCFFVWPLLLFPIVWSSLILNWAAPAEENVNSLWAAKVIGCFGFFCGLFFGGLLFFFFLAKGHINLNQSVGCIFNELKAKYLRKDAARQSLGAVASPQPTVYPETIVAQAASTSNGMVAIPADSSHVVGTVVRSNSSGTNRKELEGNPILESNELACRSQSASSTVQVAVVGMPVTADTDPTLAQMVEHFRTQLGIVNGTMKEIVDKACAELGVEVGDGGASGSGLMPKAKACWEVLHAKK